MHLFLKSTLVRSENLTWIEIVAYNIFVLKTSLCVVLCKSWLFTHYLETLWVILHNILLLRCLNFLYMTVIPWIAKYYLDPTLPLKSLPTFLIVRLYILAPSFFENFYHFLIYFLNKTIFNCCSIFRSGFKMPLREPVAIKYTEEGFLFMSLLTSVSLHSKL